MPFLYLAILLHIHCIAESFSKFKGNVVEAARPVTLLGQFGKRELVCNKWHRNNRYGV